MSFFVFFLGVCSFLNHFFVQNHYLISLFIWFYQTPLLPFAGQYFFFIKNRLGCRHGLIRRGSFNAFSPFRRKINRFRKSAFISLLRQKITSKKLFQPFILLTGFKLFWLLPLPPKDNQQKAFSAFFSSTKRESAKSSFVYFIFRRACANAAFWFSPFSAKR